MKILWAMLQLVAVDVVFIVICLIVVLLIGMAKRAAFAVMKRNFVGYFSNPTGYVFLCLFVLLTSFAAFWPHEFFNANLANLDQLSQYLPFIMLIFVPAITMSTWAEEKRQGTDELLLTLPADDFDIVIGKYLAAAAIFTVSLLFSQFSNYWMLVYLTEGALDSGLLLSTYFGYWMIGMAMLSIGMVASFLTHNLTVSFVLGIALNAPLVFIVFADTIIPKTSFRLAPFGIELFSIDDPAMTLANCSLARQADDFGHGVASVSAVSYFLMVIGIGLYVSMALIGRRHWSGGKNGRSMLTHYVIRAACLVVTLLGLTVFFYNNDYIRWDVSEGKVSSLAADTQRIIRELEPEHPITIDVFVSREVPEDYVQTKRDLILRLKELQKLSGANIRVTLNDGLEPFSKETELAKVRYNITPQQINGLVRGKFVQSEVIMGAAFKCGLEKVVVPFFDYGVPVEYELVRSIATVAQGEKRRLGVISTIAPMIQGDSRAAIIRELEKQYRVDLVSMRRPIALDQFKILKPGKDYETGIFSADKIEGPGPETIQVAIEDVSSAGYVIEVQLDSGDDDGELTTASKYQVSGEGDGELVLRARSRFDAVVAVQPSSLTNAHMANLIKSVRAGIPTAIFEDPGPLFVQAPATGDQFMIGNQLFPKADIRYLWASLGITSPGVAEKTTNNREFYKPDIVWQKYNPYKKLNNLTDDYVFIRPRRGAEKAINPEHPITKGINEIFVPAPGAIQLAGNSELKLEKLLTTSINTGTMKVEDFPQFRANPAGVKLPPSDELIIGAQITGVPPEDSVVVGDRGEKPTRINVVYVADIDVLYDQWVQIRARPEAFQNVVLQFENITFILNLIDELSGDNAYNDIRTRKPLHSTLKMIEEEVKNARDEESLQEARLQQDFAKTIEEIDEKKKADEEEFKKKLAALNKSELAAGKLDRPRRRAIEQARKQKLEQNEARKQRRMKELNAKLQKDRDRIQRETDLKISKLQTDYKLWGVCIPPIFPLLVGLIVFVYRRLREREGISRARLR